MKRIILLVYSLSIIMCSNARTVLISPTKRTPHREIKQNKIEQLLTDNQIYTILLEFHTIQEALEALPYIITLKNNNKTIICKAPENICQLLDWCPYIDNVIHIDTDTSYTIKLTLHDVATHMQPSHDKPSLIIEDTGSAIWKETLILDSKFKIGICCEPLYPSLVPLKEKLTAETLFPLGLLHNISIYNFDTIHQDNSHEHILVYQLDKQIKESLTQIATVIDHMNLIITTQPIIAYLAEALHKTVWLITTPDMDIEMLTNAHPQVKLFTEPTNEHLLCTMIRTLSSTVINPTSELITAEIAIGELIDKITILEIKAEQITDEKKLENIYRELQTLQRTCDLFITPSTELQQLTAQLKKANLALWITEDLIRDKERAKCFDDEFIALARSVYIQNDERCYVKRCINNLLGSRLIEEKSYKPYN